MPRMYNKPENLANSLNHFKVYEEGGWSEQDAAPSSLTIDEVLATQALVMQLHSRQPRSVVSGNRRHAFAALNNIDTEPFELYDGSIEEYVACRVAKVDHGEWRMRIRFRQNEISEEEKANSYLDDYSFMWNRTGNVQAWYANYQLSVTPAGSVESYRDTHPLREDDIEELHDRLALHLELASRAIVLSRAA